MKSNRTRYLRQWNQCVKKTRIKSTEMFKYFYFVLYRDYLISFYSLKSVYFFQYLPKKKGPHKKRKTQLLNLPRPSPSSKTYTQLVKEQLENGSRCYSK